MEISEISFDRDAPEQTGNEVPTGSTLDLDYILCIVLSRLSVLDQRRIRHATMAVELVSLELSMVPAKPTRNRYPSAYRKT